MILNVKVFGEGPAVIILHGLFGSSDNWVTFGKNLSAAGFQVILADLRNHGQSPHDSEFNYEVLAADVKDFIAENAIENAVVMGHSLGGKTAIKLATTFPDTLSKLIVVDIAPRYYSVTHRSILDALLAVDILNLQSRQEAEQILSLHIHDVGVRQFLLKNIYRIEKDKFAWRFNLDVINEKIENVGESVVPEVAFKKPTLFIKGEKSDYITYDDEREIYSHFEKVDVITAPESGHWIHADNPEWLLKSLIEFIEEK